MAFRSTIPFRQLCIGKSQNSAFQTELLKFSFSLLPDSLGSWQKRTFFENYFSWVSHFATSFPFWQLCIGICQNGHFSEQFRKNSFIPSTGSLGRGRNLTILRKIFFLSPVISFNPLNPPNYRTPQFEREFFNLFLCPYTKDPQQPEIEFSNGQKKKEQPCDCS